MAVRTQILEQGERNVVILFTNDDATNESVAPVTKVDVSTLSPPCDRLAIEEIKWSVGGASPGALHILWDATADDLAWTLPTALSDTVCFKDIGGLQNPMSAGATGDIQFQTTGVDISYSVVLVMKKKYD